MNLVVLSSEVILLWIEIQVPVHESLSASRKPKQSQALGCTGRTAGGRKPVISRVHPGSAHNSKEHHVYRTAATAPHPRCLDRTTERAAYCPDIRAAQF